MAFNQKGMYVVSAVGSVGVGADSTKKLHTYHHATDDAATVETAGYFNSWWRQLTKGDIILAALALDGTAVLKSYLVTASSATAVTIQVGTL